VTKPNLKGIEMSLRELFCEVDDFWQEFAPGWEARLLEGGAKQRRRKGQLCESEIMTLMIYFHQMRYLDFKTYYIQYVQRHLQKEFPQLVNYNGFVELMPQVLVPLCAYLQRCFEACTGISLLIRP
jgi:hypothetical protein